MTPVRGGLTGPRNNSPPRHVSRPGTSCGGNRPRKDATNRARSSVPVRPVPHPPAHAGRSVRPIRSRGVRRTPPADRTRASSPLGPSPAHDRSGRRRSSRSPRCTPRAQAARSFATPPAGAAGLTHGRSGQTHGKVCLTGQASQTYSELSAGCPLAWPAPSGACYFCGAETSGRAVFPDCGDERAPFEERSPTPQRASRELFHDSPEQGAP